MTADTNRTLTIDISLKTIFWFLVMIFVIWFVFQIKEILLALFVAFIFMSAFAPVVDFFDRLRIPPVLGILFTYLAFLIILFLALVAVVPIVVSQSQALVVRLPFYVSRILEVLGVGSQEDYLLQVYTNQIVQFMTTQLADLSQGAVRVTVGFVTGIVTLLTILVMSFYLLLDRRRLHQNFVSMFPLPYQERARQLTLKVEHQLGLWMRGQLTLMFIVGVMTLIGLSIIGLPFAFPLAVIAGFLEVVPIIGPILSAVPAIIIGATSSPFLGIVVAVFYTMVQQLENHLIVPQVMRRAVGLNPVAVILALAIGGKLMGIIGALLAVPMVTVIIILANEIFNLSLEKNSHFWTAVTSKPKVSDEV